MTGAGVLQISTGETLLFAVLAISMVVVAALGLLVTRKPVYTVISVIYVMVGLAFLFTMLEAPFMGVVQVVVYTGAILMMFLFVLMLIGVDTSDSGHETLKGQRAITVVGLLGIAGLLVVMVWRLFPGSPMGLEAANGDSNPVAVARDIFANHVLTLELTGTLLIVAALGAMTLTHRDRVKPKQTQEQLAHEKMQAFTEKGERVSPLPNSGVFGESNSSTNPALTAYGKPLENSVNRVLKIRGQERHVSQFAPVVVERIARGEFPSGPSTYGKAGRAKTLGMPGESAPDHDGALKKLQELEAPRAPKAEIDSAKGEE